MDLGWSAVRGQQSRRRHRRQRQERQVLEQKKKKDTSRLMSVSCEFARALSACPDVFDGKSEVSGPEGMIIMPCP